MTSSIYTGGHALTSQCTTRSLFEYTPGLGLLKETAVCPLLRHWVVPKRVQKLVPEMEFWTTGLKKMKNNLFPHFTGTIFII
jgi:hypothetical protein